MATIRLDKYLADCDLGTRTEVKKSIQSGAVKVDDQVIKKSDFKVDPSTMVVRYHDTLLSYQVYKYFVLHKPAGYITATEDKRDKTVMDLLPKSKRNLSPVGRLDKDTEGLLIITDDGQLNHDLISPTKHINKTYYARMSGTLKENAVELCSKGLTIDHEELCKPADLKVIKKEEGITEVYLTIYEGKYHQIKRMMHTLGCEVEYLKRIKIGNMDIEATVPNIGSFKEYSKDDILDMIKE